MKKPQQGYVLLVLMALVLSAGLGIFVTGLGKSVMARKAEKDSNVMTQLKNVKQRLLTYAATYPNIYGFSFGPGYLPCPTSKAEAVATAPCSGEISSGWLPRKLKTETVTFEAEGLAWDRVWYVLDNRYAHSTSLSACQAGQSHSGLCYPLNISSGADRLTLNGRGNIVALLIYAGSAHGSQSRGSAPPDIADYLEEENKDGDGDFISTFPDDTKPFNDVVLPIYESEWERVMRNRVIQSASSGDWCGAGKASAYAWFADNDWDTSAQGVCK